MAEENGKDSIKLFSAHLILLTIVNMVAVLAILIIFFKLGLYSTNASGDKEEIEDIVSFQPLAKPLVVDYHKKYRSQLSQESKFQCDLFLEGNVPLFLHWTCIVMNENGDIVFKIKIHKKIKQFSLGFGFANGSSLGNADFVIFHHDSQEFSSKVCFEVLNYRYCI